MRYQKKPVVIEAVRWDGDRFSDNPAWLIEGFKAGYVVVLDDSGQVLLFDGPNLTTARSGDYVIQGVNGEVYACPGDVFAKTYQLVVG